MAEIEEGDFIELEFTGRIKDSGKIFDTTDEELAEEEGIKSPQSDYGSVTIAVGEKQVVPGLDDALVGKEPGEYTIEVPMEDAFGKKDSDLLSIVPMREFKKQGIKPFVGMEARIDGQPGTVRSVSGGRVVVDFNHPLAGKNLEYDINITRIVEDDEEKLEAVLDIMNTPYDELEIEDDKAVITMPQDMPEDLREKAEEKIKELTGFEAEFNTPGEDDESEDEESEDSEEKSSDE